MCFRAICAALPSGLIEGGLLVVLDEPSMGRALLALCVETKVCFSLRRSMGCVVLMVCV